MGKIFNLNDGPAAFSEDEKSKAVSILNGIVAALKNSGHGWRVGYRNTMAVDMSCACHVLGLRPENVIYEINVLNTNERANAFKRFDVIEDYLERWETDGIFDKMLDPDEWSAWEKGIEPEDRYISSVVKA